MTVAQRPGTTHCIDLTDQVANQLHTGARRALELSRQGLENEMGSQENDDHPGSI